MGIQRYRNAVLRHGHGEDERHSDIEQTQGHRGHGGECVSDTEDVGGDTRKCDI